MQNRLKMEKKQTNEHWNQLIRHIAEEDRKDREFWEQINRFRGNRKTKPPKSIKNENGVELITDDDKIKAFTSGISRQYKLDIDNPKFDKENDNFIKKIDFRK